MLKKLIIFSVFLSACQSESNLSKKKYFDIKGLLESQVSDLKHLKASVDKTWIVGNNTETKTINNIDWKKELSLFQEADINKSAYLKSYDSIKTDSKIVYILKAQEDLPIRRIEIESGTPLSQISILSKTENYLFKSSSEYNLQFLNKKLKNYSVTTIQKMFFGKPDSSKIVGRIKD